MAKWRAPPGWRLLRLQVFAVKGRQCHWCGNPANTVDHLIAVQMGGQHEMSNLVPACTRCNCSRGAVLGNRLRGARRHGRVVPVSQVAPRPSPFTPSREW